MSNISSVSGYVPPAPAAKTQVDFNSAAYQPMTSGGQGVGDAIANSASAVVSFSEESLQKLGESFSAGVDSVQSAFSDAGEGIRDAVDSVGNSAVALYEDVAQMAENGWNSVQSAAHDSAAYVGLVDDDASASSGASTTTLV